MAISWASGVVLSHSSKTLHAGRLPQHNSLRAERQKDNGEEAEEEELPANCSGH